MIQSIEAWDPPKKIKCCCFKASEVPVAYGPVVTIQLVHLGCLSRGRQADCHYVRTPCGAQILSALFISRAFDAAPACRLDEHRIVPLMVKGGSRRGGVEEEGGR